MYQVNCNVYEPDIDGPALDATNVVCYGIQKREIAEVIAKALAENAKDPALEFSVTWEDY